MIERVEGGKQGGNITEMYGSYSDEDLNEWERMPQNIRVLTSSAFGAWLLRRDKRIKERETKIGHWIWDNERSDCYDTTFKCSCCGREIIVPYESHTSVYTDYPYCHCGARMREESE